MNAHTAAPDRAAHNLARFTEPYVVLDDGIARHLMDYLMAASHRCSPRSRIEFRIPAFVADAWQVHGHAVLSASRIASTYGVTRSTVRGAIKKLVRAGVIKIIGNTPDGRLMYAPCLEIGEEYRAIREARDAAR